MLSGREEQTHKTCDAASVAGALNCALRSFLEDAAASAHPPEHAASQAGLKPRGKRLLRAAAQGCSMNTNRLSGAGRICEHDVIAYYCRWSRETSRSDCLSALWGLSGLFPSTRGIGNLSLLRACHAVSASFFAA